MPKAWKPTFSKISLEQLKNHRARSLCSKICKTESDIDIGAWPLRIMRQPNKPALEAEVVEPTHEFQPILPELWQNWMAKEIMTQQVVQDHFDYLEAMERRDKITDALIVLRSEAAQLKMQDVLARISTAGAELLDELWQKGGLGD